MQSYFGNYHINKTSHSEYIYIYIYIYIAIISLDNPANTVCILKDLFLSGLEVVHPRATVDFYFRRP